MANANQSKKRGRGRPRINETHGTPAQRARNQPDLSSFFCPPCQSANSSSSSTTSSQGRNTNISPNSSSTTTSSRPSSQQTQIRNPYARNSTSVPNTASATRTSSDRTSSQRRRVSTNSSSSSTTSSQRRNTNISPNSSSTTTTSSRPSSQETRTSTSVPNTASATRTSSGRASSQRRRVSTNSSSSSTTSSQRRNTNISPNSFSTTTSSRPSSQETRTSTSVPNTASATCPSSDRASSQSRRVQNAQDPSIRVRENASDNSPSMNAEQVWDDELFSMGKSIRDCPYLLSQKKKILDSTYFKKASKNAFDNGIFWDRPPTFPQGAYQLKDCWKEFHKLPIFNWFPEAMMGPGWKPCCKNPHCRKPLVKNGTKNEPRLVFGQHENYWLNAPQQYKCTACENTGESYIYTSTSEDILKQISAAEPEVFEIFPCHLTRKNAIDKKLMELVVHSAIKGIGPSTMSETIASWHELTWQQKENLWGRYVDKKLHQPSVIQQPIHRSQIQKCPFYFSKEMGGCVPSGKWLVHMFCHVISSMRKYLDSECIKRALTSLILAIDASYKVPKWMMKWGKKFRIYDALLSGTNEYNEIVMQIFATSDNHQELGLILAAMNELGLKPDLAFSDDPERDESILCRYISSLENGDLDREEEVVPENLTEFSTEKRLIYLHDIDTTKLILSQFRQDLENEITNSDVKISIDAEWPVKFEGGPNNRRRTRGDINILQLGSNVIQYTVVLELYNFINNPVHMRAIGMKLQAIFSLQVSCITGCHHQSDYTSLQKQYPVFGLKDLPKSLIHDVSVMALNRGLAKRGKDQTTLQQLCKKQGFFLRKSAHVRVGDVFGSKNGRLSQEAQRYCQLDVEAPLILHQIYLGHPDLTLRLSRSTLPPINSTVDVMPSGAKAIGPIAQGKIIQRGGTWSSNGFVLTNKHVLVKIEKVFNPRGVIHYPCTLTEKMNCACGRPTHGKIEDDCNFYLMSQYGPPPFVMVELASRLRAHNEMIKYPSCVYEDNVADVDTLAEQIESVNLTPQVELVEGDDGSIIGDDEDSVNSSEENEDVTHAIREQVAAILGDEEDMSDEEGEGETDTEDAPTHKQQNMAMREDFQEILDKLIRDADELAENSTDVADDTDVRENAPLRKVLADLFHVMDRAKVPMHHDYKCLYFRALRAAIFIMNQEDVENVKEILNGKDGTSWEQKMAFDFSYISARVRRTVPPPDVLYYRMKTVFEFFKDKVDSTTNQKLFNTRAENKFKNVLEMVKKGYCSDPPGMELYVEKTDKWGRKIVDEDGLTLYRSARGTSNLESLHQYLTTSFGHTIAGPYYSDCLLAIVKHHYNWRQSRKNRPGFPPIGHYNGLLIDRINELYERIYGHKKYVDWSEYNENIPLKSAYGIVEVDKSLTSELVITEEDKQKISKNQMLKYLAERQGAPVPFLPIRSTNEKKLIHHKLNQYISEGHSLKSQTTFEKLATDWNQNHINISDGIFPKMACHFSKYIKSWRKNQDRRDAATQSGSNLLTEALSHVPNAPARQTFEPAPLNISNRRNSATDRTAATSSLATVDPVSNTTNMETLCQVIETQQPLNETPTNTQPAGKKRRKTCTMKIGGQKCPFPDTCPSISGNDNCYLITRGDPSKRTKRKSPVFSGPRKCAVCKRPGCKGSGGRRWCTFNRSNT